MSQAIDPVNDPLNTLTGQAMASQEVATASLGPPVAGWILNVILWGAVCSNMLSYTSTERFGRASKRTKAVLWLVFLADSTVALINVFQLFHYTTSQKRDQLSLFMVMDVDAMPPALIGLTGLLVQGYLAERTSRLFHGNQTKRMIFLSGLGVLMAISFLASIGASALFMMYHKGTVERAKPFTFLNLAGTWMWTAAFVDISITAGLILQLKRHIVGFNAVTDSLLRRLMRGAMMTAAYTSILSITGAILGVSFNLHQLKTSNVLLAFDCPLASLYALSLLSNLSSDPSKSATNTYNPGTLAHNHQALATGVNVQIDFHVATEQGEEFEMRKPPPRQHEGDLDTGFRNKVHLDSP